jgi:hypothetical protein
LKPNGVTTTHETINTLFQIATIAMVGLFSLAETVKFIAANMI